MASLNRSNATAARGARPLPPRLYTATTPRGQVPALPLLHIPAAGPRPRVQTSNLPALSTGGGDHAAREQSREMHNQALSIVTRPAESASPAPGQQLAGQLEQLSLTPASARAGSVGSGSSSSNATAAAAAAAADDEEEYALCDANIKVMRKLGEGSVGTVHKIEYLPARKIMARKLMAVYPDEANHRQIVRELRLLKQCQSPYIVKFYGAYCSTDDDGQSIAICMEYCEGGSLESVYKRVDRLRGHIGEGVLGKVAVAVLNGLVHLHASKVIHRDVKPSNILLTGRGEIKLCDFGVSGELVDSIAQTFVGTSYYMAPERIQGDRYAVQSDV
ncbi:Protein kinase C signaling pathway involved MAPKK protein, partial [Coemansia helicoidea]